MKVYRYETYMGSQEELMLPELHEFLHMQVMSPGELSLWFKVDPTAELGKYTIYTYHTDVDMEPWLNYLGTYIQPDGPVLHVFMKRTDSI